MEREKMYIVEIKNPNFDLIRKRKIAEHYELSIKENVRGKHHWHTATIRVSKSEKKKVLQMCKGMKYVCYDEKYGRSSNYREEFFKHNHPDARKWGDSGPNNLWYCRYCHRKIPSKKMQVDHVIPVNKAKRMRKRQKKLPNGVNDVSNLVPSCRRCNRFKSDQTGLWLVRAKLGKYRWYWKLVNIVRVLFFVALFVVLREWVVPFLQTIF